MPSRTPEELAEATKKVRAEKPKENFMRIRLTDNQLVVNHSDGVKLLATLATAEVFNKSWGSDRHIVPLDSSSFEVTPMSPLEYEQYKIAALLNISIDEVKAMAEAAKQPTPP